ncbi:MULTISPECIES: dicarboxylate/amino acid:cation symporter [unclassified Oscillibacter]|uniref:dicarboxylate/amino acid:cation symporter n=1 Tax=unclassified Oscillibacter TaxID=2629304 RepID=UPI0025DEAEA6|nr:MULTISPECIES: dicarboxylate/amino acid:cation symporter [unclassified Oscillibacter]
MREKLLGKKYLPHRTILGFLLGIVIGLFFYDFSVWVKPFGTAFMNMIKMLIVPVIFFSLTSGIASIGDVNRLKRVGAKVVAVYVAMTVIACMIGLVIVNIIHPGVGFDTSVLSAYDASELTTPDFGAFLLDMIPTNIVAAMSDQNIMQMIFFTLIFGISLVFLGKKAQVVTDFMTQTAGVIYKMLDIIMIYSPIGVFALMANTTAVYGPQLFGSLAKFVATDYTSCLLAWAGFSLFVKAYTGVRYGKMCKAMVPIWVNTLATNSSAGTIPITMDVTTKRLGIPNSIASFSIPLGATINLTGAAIYKTILAFFVAEIYGLTLTPSQIIMVISISTLMSIAAPGIPGGGIVTGAIFLNLLNLPMDLMGPIAGMYRLIDMSHTTLNVSGDVLGTMFVAKSENLWNPKEFNESTAAFETINVE